MIDVFHVNIKHLNCEFLVYDKMIKLIVFLA